MKKLPLHSITFSLLFLAFFVINAFLIQSAAIGFLLFVFYLAFFGNELGGVFHQEKGVLRWWIGTWLLLSIILIVGSIAYYVAVITPEVIYGIILLSVPIILWLSKKYGQPHLFERVHDLWKAKRHNVKQPVWIAASLVVLLCIYVLSMFQSEQILDAVRSPWPQLSTSILVAMGLLLLLLMVLLYRGRERSVTLPLFALTLFVFVSLVAFVFPIGYGFDSFIHQATELHLAEFGTISPKPFYYIGQYALVLFAHHGFAIPVETADTFLVPFLLALLLPFAWYGAAVHLTKKKRVSTTTLVGIFLLPLAGFIVTTPQSFANLWTLLLILASVPYLLKYEHPRLGALSIAAVATLFIHPIAGIPAVFYVALLLSDPQRAPHRWEAGARLMFWILAALASIVLPLSFVANALISKQSLGINWSALNPLHWFGALNLGVFFENRFSPLLDFVYLYGFNTIFVVVLVSAFAWWTHRNNLGKKLRPLLVMAIALLINYLLLKTAIDFTFLIDYERQNYANRLIPLFVFFLTPLFIIGLSQIFLSVRKKPIVMRVSLIVLLSAISLSSFYLTYPRKDAYTTNRGFNVSQSDVNAVHLIDEWAEDQPYLVLANQSVSAIAIKDIGFHYYSDLFFYPIPTGDVLYKKFLNMNTKPSREIALEALDLVPMHGDVTTLFYVVNDYWWQASRIVETAKANADDWRAINNGAVHVFRYDFELNE